MAFGSADALRLRSWAPLPGTHSVYCSGLENCQNQIVWFHIPVVETRHLKYWVLGPSGSCIATPQIAIVSYTSKMLQKDIRVHVAVATLCLA